MRRSYALKEALRHLRVAKSTFWQSGLGKVIPHTRGKWDAAVVDEVAAALARRRALVQMGVLPKNYPLVKAVEEFSTALASDLDIQCPQCGLMATLRPANTPEMMGRFIQWLEAETPDVSYPAACGWCGWMGEV